MRPQFEPGNTVQFTFTSSVAPDAAPTFKVLGSGNTVLTSITALQSNTTNYYALYTMPTTEGAYVGEWYTTKTVTTSAYPYVKRFVFNIKLTEEPR